MARVACEYMAKDMCAIDSFNSAVIVGSLQPYSKLTHFV